MSTRRTTLEVARWEFLRFFKVKDQIISLVIIIAVAVGIWGIGKIASQGRNRPATIALVAPPELNLRPPAGTRLELERRTASEIPALLREVSDRSLDGLLVATSPDSATLHVAKNVPWESELETAFQTASKDARLRRMGLSAEDEAMLSRPAGWDVQHGEPGARERKRAAVVWSAVFIGLTLLGLYMGNAYLFIAITGEKRLRVTEQVISAIPAQVWIDGKILGLSGVAAASTLVIGVGVVVAGWITAMLESLVSPATVGSGAAAAAEGSSADGGTMALLMVDPGFLLIAIVFALLGFLFWFTFFAAIASTINDPNTSNRNIFLFVPMIPVSVTFLGLKDPDGPLLRALGLLPFSSHAAMPVRIAVGEPRLWEVVVSLAILLASIWLLRRAAGKVFGLGMLLYGKEPRWGEMWRWIREA